MSRYDHALNKKSKKTILKKVNSIFNKTDTDDKSDNTSNDRSDNNSNDIIRTHRSDNTGNNTGGPFGTQGVTGAQALPSNPNAYIQPMRNNTQNTSLNSISDIRPSEDGTAFEGTAPSSLHFTITCPGGYRAFIPLRNLNIRVINSNTIEMILSPSIVNNIIDDIVNNGGRDRVQRNGSL